MVGLLDSGPEIAVLVPCYNEELTVGSVVRDFLEALPEAHVYVFDNNSTDQTARIAREAGATVVPSPKQGKGNVVRHMFRTIDADLYVMVDGDDTYPADHARKLIDALLDSGADLVVGSRLASFEDGSFRKFHQFGNRLISGIISLLFRTSVSDVLSGYRVFSREFAKTVPLTSEGFEIETELTLQAAAKGFTILEVPTPYGTRPEGSESKLDTWSDGVLIARAIGQILVDYHPMLFFGAVSLLFVAASLAAGYLPVLDYYRTGLVLHIPRAILASGLGVLATLFFGIGLILRTAHRYHNETFALMRKLASK